MDQQLYLDLDTDLMVAQIEEWIGREYGRDLGRTEYPIPPDHWYDGTGRDVPRVEWIPPVGPPVESWLWFATRAVPKPNNQVGGVIILTDDILRYATQAQTLSDGTTFSFNISANAKTADALSPSGLAAITPPAGPP